MNLIQELNLTAEDVVSTKKLSLRGEKKYLMYIEFH
jgi:hypothetical protein